MTADLLKNVAEDPGDSGDSWNLRDVLVAIAAFALILALAAGGYLFYQARKSPTVLEGSTAPDFSLPLLEGGEARLSDYRGKVVLLNIWATWCGPCRTEMPYMERMYQSLQGQPFEILAVSVDEKGAEDVAPFVRELGLSFPILLDPDKKVEGLYQTSRVPESFIIDKNGVVRRLVIGPLQPSHFEEIRRLLVEP